MPPILAGSRLGACWWVADELALEPVALCEALADQLRQRGAELRFGVEVRGLLRRDGAVVGVDTDQDR